MNRDSSPVGAVRSRILIADDCATSRLMEETILRAAGHEIVTALDGAQAVEMALAQPPDLIVLDLNMPRLNGLEALKELKRSPLTRHVPVIVVTIAGNPDAYLQASQSGCSAFLTKPFDGNALLTSVERNLAAGSRLRPRQTAPATDKSVA